MKKVKDRALSALILVGITIIGLMIFTVRLVVDGQTWVAFASRSDMRIAGTLSVGTLTDRNGVILADIDEGRRVFAEDRTVRKDNTILYLSNRYSVPLGTFQREKEVQVECIENKLKIYRIENNHARI